MRKLLLPRLGQTMTEGTLGEWLVQENEQFAVGAKLYEVETDKSTSEVEANEPGRIVRVLADIGDTVPVGSVLAIVAQAEENPTREEIDAFLAGDDLEAAVESRDAAPAEPENGASGTPGAPAMTTSSTTDVPPTAHPVSVDGAAGNVRAMPRTRRLATTLGVDLTSIAGTGHDGLITEADVHEASMSTTAERQPTTVSNSDTQISQASTPTITPLPQDVAIKESRKLTGVTKTMAQVTARSWNEVATFTQELEVRARRWKAARDRLRSEIDPRIGYNDMVLESVVRALAVVPEVNSSYNETELVIWEDINISIAVDSPAGLLVPVLKKAHTMDIGERVAKTFEIVDRARAGSLTPADMEGGTITVSNLGMYGIERGFPMVTAPQSAIVFVGAMKDRVLALNGGITVMPAFSVTSAFDHRALDGVTAAKFSMALKEEMEKWE